MQERAAKREALQHPARVRAGPLAAGLPKAEALEQHPDPLPPFRYTVEAPVQVEVLDRGQLAVDERLVREVAELATLGAHLQLAGGRDQQASAEPQQRRLAGAIRPGHDEEAAPRKLEVDRLERALVSEAASDRASADHGASFSRACCSRNSAASFAVGGVASVSTNSSGSG